MLDFDDIKKQVKENEDNFIASLEWLKTKLKIASFSTETLYLLRQLAFYIDVGRQDEELAGIDQERIISLVKDQIAEEKKTEAARQYSRAVTAFGAEEKDAPPRDEPQQAEPLPAELELFSTQEREGIKAIAAYQGVLYGALPAVAAFREQYLPERLLSTEEAEDFLRSVAIRFLSASDFERSGVDALSHQAEALSLATAKLTTEQKEQLTGEMIVYPSLQRPYSAEEGAGRWYKYTVAIALRSLGANGTKSNPHIIEKTLVVRENKPFLMFTDPFFPQDQFAVIEDSSFPHYFPSSIADELHKIISSRRASGAIPGDARMKASFVLTGTLSYNPVTIRIAKQPATDLNSLEAGPMVARQMERNGGFFDTVVVEADAWITADTIRKIYHAQQTSLSQTASRKTRYKISGAESFQLVTEVIGIYLEEKGAPSYQHAYRVLRQAGKVTGTADNFRKRYKRACEILRVPFHLDVVIEYLRKHL